MPTKFSSFHEHMELTLPVIDDVMRDEAVVLIKPQFEAGRERISKGVVRDKAVHVDVLESMTSFIHDNTGFKVASFTHSDSNTNYGINDIVNNAHEILGR